MRSLCQLLLVVSMVSATTAIIVLRVGKCPRLPIKQNFDVTRYMGRWWEYQRFPNPFEFGVQCGFANYTLLSDTSVKVVNSGEQPEIKFLWFVIRKRQRTTSIGEAVIVDPAEPSNLQVSFGGMPGGSGEPNYFVVDTDYDNYAVVYSCSEYGFLNTQLAWILTRGQGVPPANLQQIRDTFSQAGVDLSPFITVKHKNCSPYTE